jgi:hypothetical protein
LALLGEKQLARETMRKTMDTETFKRRKDLAPIWRNYLLLAQINNGDFGDALDTLELQMSQPGPQSWPIALKSPLYDDLRDHPRFEEIERRLKGTLAEN